MRRLRARRYMAGLAAIGAAALTLPLLAAVSAPAQAAPTPPVSFIAHLSDTRATGRYEWTPGGLHVWTSGSPSSVSTNKVAEYFAQSGPLPTSASMAWTGTQPQPGLQLVFDADGIDGNGNDYNILVGEPVYNGNWWLTNASSNTAKAADPSGAANGGNGSEWFGTLAQWRVALPDARLYAVGFSLGSGVLGNGTIASMTFGDQHYNFVPPPTADLSITKEVAPLPPPVTFVPELADTRATGHHEWTDDGLHVWTSGSPSSVSTNKVAEYFAQSGALPTSASMAWTGTQPQPGLQLVFDADGIDGNGNDYNILVGEPVYNGNWWLTNASSNTAKAADPSGAANGGNGSEWFGTLAQWRAALPGARLYAVGFSLGSGILGDGTIASMTFGDKHYDFTRRFGPVLNANPGETVEYKITVSNGGTPGTAAAQNVVVTDVLPPELTYVPGTLIDSGNGCAFAGQVLTCNAGTYPAGTSSTIRFQAEIDDEITTTTTGQVINQGHWVEVQKNETFADLAAGQTRTYSTYCSPGFVATDGGLLVDAVDQGGSYADLVVLESKKTSDSGLNGWTVTTKNNGMFRGQGKVKVTCLRDTVGSSDNHSHSITIAPSTGTTAIAPAEPAASGRTVTRACPQGYAPIAPEYSVTAGSMLVLASRAVGNTWAWTVNHSAGTNATFGLSCLPPRTNLTQTHMSDLQVTTKTDTVSFNPGTRGEGQLTCDNNLGNGIVGGWDRAAAGPLSLGMESRGVTYMYRFFNPQATPATADIQLTCVGVRTADEAKYYHVVNTATVTTTTADQSGHDNSSTTDVGINMDAMAAPNRGVNVDATGTRTVVQSKTTFVNLKVQCTKACSFTAKVQYSGQLVAKGPFTLAANPGWQTIQVPTNAKGTYQGSGPVVVRIKTAKSTTTFKVTLS